MNSIAGAGKTEMSASADRKGKVDQVGKSVILV